MPKPKTDPAEPGHNATARKAIINNAVREVMRLDGEIAALQQERQNVKNKAVKGDLGMKVSDFNILLRFHKLEDEDRDSLFDTLREGFRALGIGTQSTFLEALDKPKRGKKAAAPEPSEPASPDDDGAPEVEADEFEDVTAEEEMD